GRRRPRPAAAPAGAPGAGLRARPGRRRPDPAAGAAPGGDTHLLRYLRACPMDGESSSIATPALSQRDFRPPAYLRNPHLQTLLGSIGPKRIRAARLAANRRGESLELRADDGTVLLGEFDPAPAPRDAVAILLHGWAGSSRSDRKSVA